MFTNQVRLVNSCCLYEITFTVKPLELVYLRTSSTQLRCFHETTVQVEAIVRVYLPFPTGQFALFLRNNYSR